MRVYLCTELVSISITHEIRSATLSNAKYFYRKVFAEVSGKESFSEKKSGVSREIFKENFDFKNMNCKEIV